MAAVPRLPASLPRRRLPLVLDKLRQVLSGQATFGLPTKKLGLQLPDFPAGLLQLGLQLLVAVATSRRNCPTSSRNVSTNSAKSPQRGQTSDTIGFSQTRALIVPCYTPNPPLDAMSISWSGEPPRRVI
jgi:hypothetical protein